MFKLLNLFLAVLCVSSSTLASSSASFEGEQVLRRKLSNGVIQYWVIRREDGRWLATLFEQNPGDLQDKLEERRFADEKQLEIFMDSQLQGFQSVNVNSFTESATTKVQLDPMLHQNLWVPTETWSWEWEKRYHQWVEEVATPDYLQLNGVATDCADVAVALRWIFARIHSLPAGNRIAGSNTLFSQASMRPAWQNLRKTPEWQTDEVFREALDYILNNTYTHSVVRDSYPFAINADALIAGAYHIYLGGDSGHTQVIHKVNDFDHIRLMASTIPREVRGLWDYAFRIGEYMPEGHGGLIRPRWVVATGNSGWRLVEPREMPHYSLEQYTPEFQRGYGYFYQAVNARLYPNEDLLREMNTGFEVLTQALNARVQAVREGWEFCSRNDCSPGSVNYENYSTPSRDHRIMEYFQQIEALCEYACDEYPDLRSLYEQKLAEVLTIEADLRLPLRTLLGMWHSQSYSSDPRVARLLRWGIHTPDTIRIATHHPYADGERLNWIVYVPGASSMKVKFTDFVTEEYYDTLVITDSSGTTIQYTGALGPFETEAIPGNMLNFYFYSDSSITAWGFEVESIQALP